MAKLEISDSEGNNCFDKTIGNITLTDGKDNQYSIYVDKHKGTLNLQYIQSQGSTEIYQVTGLNNLIRDFFNFRFNDTSQLSETFARVDGDNISKDNGLVNKLMSHYTVKAHDFFTDMEQQYNAMSND